MRELRDSHKGRALVSALVALGLLPAWGGVDSRALRLALTGAIWLTIWALAEALGAYQARRESRR